MTRRFYFFVMVILVTVGLAVPVFAGDFEEQLFEETSLCGNSTAMVGPEEDEVLGGPTTDEDARLGKVKSYYEQPKFKTKDGYDLIRFYLSSATDGLYGLYVGTAYFIVDKTKSENNWMLYNFKEETANRYLVGTSADSGDKILPVVENQTRSDDPSTSFIDESRVPVIAKEAFDEMYCDWISFSEIPFAKSGDGSLIYAWYYTYLEGEEDEEDDEEEDEEEDEETSSTDHDPDEWHKYDLNLESGSSCSVLVTKSVSYNGKYHVLDTSPVRKNKSNDVSVKVYFNGKLIAPNTYKVQFRNNKNCNRYGGSDNTPYIKLKFKSKDKSTKADFKAIERKKFGFDILPLDISEGTISYKSIKNGQLKKGIWTNGDATINLAPPKGTQGDYTLDGNTIIGKNNFYGKLKFTDIYIDGGDVH